MPIIDAKLHAYERDHPGRPWHAVLAGPDEATGDQTVAMLDANGVDGAILVSAFTMYRYDPSYALEVYKRHPGRFALVRPVDAIDVDQVTEVVDVLDRQRRQRLGDDADRVDSLAREGARAQVSNVVRGVDVARVGIGGAMRQQVLHVSSPPSMPLTRPLAPPAMLRRPSHSRHRAHWRQAVTRGGPRFAHRYVSRNRAAHHQNDQPQHRT